jgi:hypothetical protein
VIYFFVLTRKRGSVCYVLLFYLISQRKTPQLVRMPNQGLLIVSVRQHHKVFLSDAGVYQLLGYRSDEILGQSFRCFCGPSTDETLLGLCLEEACHSRSLAVQLVLYVKDGVAKNILVRMAPFRESGRISGCTMILSESEAIPWSMAVQGDGDYAHLLLSADAPFTLKNFNALFHSIFGFAAALSAGLPISKLRGRRSSLEEWSRPFFTAANGLVSESIVYARTSVCPAHPFNLRCEPVVLLQNGKIAFISATFSPLEHSCATIDPV